MSVAIAPSCRTLAEGAQAMSHRIINRHRPLRPGQRSARYRRLRDAEHPEDRLIDSDDDDRYDYDRYDDYDDYDYEHGVRHRDLFDLRWCQLELRLADTGPFNPVLRSGDVPGACAVEPGRDHTPAAVSDVPVERRLAEHCAWLIEGSSPAPWSSRQLDPDLRHMIAMAQQHIADAHGQHSRSRSPLTVVAAVLMLCPFWTRPPRTWRPAPGQSRDVIVSLVEHVFGRFAAPRFLANAFAQPRHDIELRWLLWYVALAQGGSLRRLSQWMRQGPHHRGWGAIPKKLAAQLTHVPAHLQPKQGVMVAEVLRLGGSSIEVGRLSLDRSFQIDPTVHAADHPERAFWEQAVRWLVRHRERLDDAECRQILGWARHRHTERGREPFSLAGRTPQSAYREARQYVRHRARYHRFVHWSGRGWDFRVPVDEVSWSITELLDSEALFEEGNAMRHCVVGYAGRCAGGLCAIFSVRRDGQRRLTVEVRLRDRQIVQARGVCNRLATEEEKALLRRWETEVLRQIDEDRAEATPKSSQISAAAS